MNDNNNTMVNRKALFANRRKSALEATVMRRRYIGRAWFAGGLIAIPLSVPFLNLIVPLVGVAVFTHLYHRLDGWQRMEAGVTDTAPSTPRP